MKNADFKKLKIKRNELLVYNEMLRYKQQQGQHKKLKLHSNILLIRIISA